MGFYFRIRKRGKGDRLLFSIIPSTLRFYYLKSSLSPFPLFKYNRPISLRIFGRGRYRQENRGHMHHGIENEMKFVVIKSLKGPDHQELMLRKSFPDTDFEEIRKPARHQDLRSGMHADPCRRRPNGPL